jgi:hypothetical protein
MNTQIRVDDVPTALRECEAARIKDVLNVNWRPHPLMVDSKMVVYASNHCGGMLGQEAIDHCGCGWHGKTGNRGPRCNQPSSAHTCDTVLLVELKRDATQDEIRAWLLTLKPWVEANRIESFSFLEGHKIA